MRPATSQLYGLDAAHQAYLINPRTGVATRVCTSLQFPPDTEADIDFNPAADRLRAVSAARDNLRPDPNDTAQAPVTDTDLAHAGGDPNAGGEPRVVGAAYTNNRPRSATYPAAPTTALFDIDVATDALVRQDPNAGTLTAVKALGFDADGAGGFDIATDAVGANVGYAALSEGGTSSLCRLELSADLSTATVAAAGALPATDKLRDIAVATNVPALVVLASGRPQTLHSVRADAPGRLNGSVPVSGLQPGERLVGLDTRPFDTKLYGLGSSSRLYVLDLSTGSATAVSPAPFGDPAIGPDNLAFDFNPAMDSAAARLIQGTANGTLGVADNVFTKRAEVDYPGIDGVLDDPDVRAAAYTQLVAGPPVTRLLDVDVRRDELVEQIDFDAGTLVPVGALGIDTTANAALEAVDLHDQLFGASELASLTGGSSLYAVNAGGVAGGATFIGQLGLPAGVVAEGLATQTSQSGTRPPPGSPSPSPSPSPAPVPDVITDPRARAAA